MNEQDKLEKVIKGLECCVNDLGECEFCPYDEGMGKPDCGENLYSDALALLKAQEPVVMAGAELTDAELIEAIRKAPITLKPAVDAVPVVHGRWIRYSEIFHEPEYTLVKCSVCGGESCCDADYCPNCGAKMDGERRDDDGKDA